MHKLSTTPVLLTGAVKFTQVSLIVSAVPVTSLPGLQIEVLKAGAGHFQYAIEAYGIHTAWFHYHRGRYPMVVVR